MDLSFDHHSLTLQKITKEIFKMLDDFDVMIQSDEIIPEEYDDWCAWVYGGAFREEEN